MRSLLLHDNFTTLASIRFGVLQPHYHDWAWFPPEGKSRWDERSLEFSAILDARQLEKTENHSLEMTRFRQFCMKRHRKESTELETQEPGFYRHTSSRHSHTGLQVTVLRGSRALNRHFPWLLLLLPLPGTQGKGWTAVASCGRCFANSFRLMKNWGQRQNWGTPPSFPSTHLSATEEKTGKRFAFPHLTTWSILCGLLSPLSLSICHLSRHLETRIESCPCSLQVIHSFI